MWGWLVAGVLVAGDREGYNAGAWSGLVWPDRPGVKD